MEQIRIKFWFKRNKLQLVITVSGCYSVVHAKENYFLN